MHHSPYYVHIIIIEKCDIIFLKKLRPEGPYIFRIIGKVYYINNKIMWLVQLYRNF